MRTSIYERRSPNPKCCRVRCPQRNGPGVATSPARSAETAAATGLNRFSAATMILTVVGFLLAAATASAHEAGPADFNELRYWWVFDPGIVVPIVLSGILYAVGVARLRRVNRKVVGGLEVACFVAGWLTLIIALVSPLHPWGSVLFSPHMTQHELLMLVAAPLLEIGRAHV